MESENESRIYRKRYFYVLLAFCLIVYLAVYKQYWTVQSAERAILEQWAEAPFFPGRHSGGYCRTAGFQPDPHFCNFNL